MIRFKIILLIYILIIISCKNEKCLLVSTNRPNIIAEAYLDQDKITIVYKISNNDRFSYFIPISNWNIQFKQDSTYYLISEPKNPFLLNTIHFYAENSTLMGISEMDQPTEIDYFPKILQIFSSDTCTIKIEIKNLYVNNSKPYKRLRDSIKYQILSKITILDEKVFFCLLRNVNIDHLGSEFVINKNTIEMTIPIEKELINFDFSRSCQFINKNESRIINEIFNVNKVILKAKVNRVN